MSSLDVPGEQNRRYCQLYLLDSSAQATDVRMQHPANEGLDRILLERLTDYIVANNHYAERFLQAGRLLRQPDALLQLVFNREYSDPDVHACRQNTNTAQNEVAAVFVLDGDGIPAFDRDFAVYLRQDVDQPENFDRQEYVNPTSGTSFLRSFLYSLRAWMAH